jgi:Transcriptional regulator, AbiEi antitoxin, Type IV TA system
MGLMTREESNRLVLIEPMRILKQWASATNYSILNSFQDFYSFDSEFEAFVSKIKRVPHELGRKYALTLHAAAWLMAPYVRPTDFHIYIHPSLTKEETLLFSKSLGLSPIEKSGNVKLVTPYDEGVFYESMNVKGVNVVSPVQLFVDLYNYPGRGEEAADKVLEKIEKNWRAIPNV